LSGSPSGGTGSGGTTTGGSTTAGSTTTGGVTTGGTTTGGSTTGGGGTNGPSSLLGLGAGPTPTARLHKLTTFEFANSLHDLLGSAAPVAAVETDFLVNGFATIGASTVTASPAGVSLYETAISGATTYAFADATRAAAALSCVPKATTDTACLTQAVTTFGRRAFRRPLTTEETSRYVNLVTTIGNQMGSSILIGLRHGINAILESPNFLYRVELGASSQADAGRTKYNSFEIASRLAATIWSSAPDDALLDAAVQDSLSTPDGIRAQATRMLADQRIHRALASFVDQLLDARLLPEADKDAQMFPAWTPTLRTAMQQEAQLRFDDMVYGQKGDYLSLFDSRTTFVNNELARFYGLPEATPDAFRRVDLPADSPRVGLLGAGMVLAVHARPQRTSPTLRGRFVNEMLLCRSIPPPPPGVPPFPDAANANATVRDRLTMHRSAATCASCHGVMDPIGFGMENFDSSGQFQAKDNGQPVDASGEIDGMAFTSLATLGAAIKKEAVAGPCLISKLYASALGRTPIVLDSVAIDHLAQQFADAGNKVDQLLVDLVTSDSFRFVEPPK
jgi:hypothetical protein